MQFAQATKRNMMLSALMVTGACALHMQKRDEPSHHQQSPTTDPASVASLTPARNLIAQNRTLSGEQIGMQPIPEGPHSQQQQNQIQPNPSEFEDLFFQPRQNTFQDMQFLNNMQLLDEEDDELIPTQVDNFERPQELEVAANSNLKLSNILRKQSIQNLEVATSPDPLRSGFNVNRIHNNNFAYIVASMQTHHEGSQVAFATESVAPQKQTEQLGEADSERRRESKAARKEQQAIVQPVYVCVPSSTQSQEQMSSESIDFSNISIERRNQKMARGWGWSVLKSFSVAHLKSQPPTQFDIENALKDALKYQNEKSEHVLLEPSKQAIESKVQDAFQKVVQAQTGSLTGRRQPNSDLPGISFHQNNATKTTCSWRWMARRWFRFDVDEKTELNMRNALEDALKYRNGKTRLVMSELSQQAFDSKIQAALQKVSPAQAKDE